MIKEPPPKWTKTEDDVLIKLYNNMTPYPEISETTGRSDAAIRNRAYKLGLRKRAIALPRSRPKFKECKGRSPLNRADFDRRWALFLEKKAANCSCNKQGERL